MTIDAAICVGTKRQKVFAETGAELSDEMLTALRAANLDATTQNGSVRWGLSDSSGLP
jgi:hypothetical protein